MHEATATLVQDMQFMVEMGSGHAMIIDAKPNVGGKDSGPPPMDLMAGSIVGCTAMDVISILRKMREKVTGLKVHVDAEHVDEHPKKLTHIHITYTVMGFNLDEKKVKQAIELSETRYCPAMASLRPGAEITNEYIIIEAVGENLVK
jgi:putative redox protein